MVTPEPGDHLPTPRWLPNADKPWRLALCIWLLAISTGLILSTIVRTLPGACP